MNDCIKRLAMVGMMLGSGWLLAGDADDVIRLKQAGVSEDVMLAYIQNRDASESFVPVARCGLSVVTACQ